MFETKEIINKLVFWIKNWFDHNGPDCKAVIGISGGKDSSVVAALCVEALGKDRVFGVLMPNGKQADIGDSLRLVSYLGIDYVTINIENMYKSTLFNMINNNLKISEQTQINLAPRLRMATLYAVSQSINGRVSNNCNLSEDWVGYSTRWGDDVGDFAPLRNLTVAEVIAIGEELGLPEELVNKAPSDGLCGKSDEDNLGFTYEELDECIRTGKCSSLLVKDRIDSLHKKNRFKLLMPPSFNPNLTYYDLQDYEPSV